MARLPFSELSNIHNHLKGDEKGAFPARGVSCGGRLPEDGKLPTPLPGVLRAPPFSPYSHSPHFAEKSKFEHIVEAAVWWMAFDRRGTAEAATPHAARARAALHRGIALLRIPQYQLHE